MPSSDRILYLRSRDRIYAHMSFSNRIRRSWPECRKWPIIVIHKVVLHKVVLHKVVY